MASTPIKYALRLGLAILVPVICAPNVEALSPGLYYASTHRSEFNEVCKVRMNADQEIVVVSLDKLWSPGLYPLNQGRVTFMSREQFAPILANQRNKGILTVYVQQGSGYIPPAYEKAHRAALKKTVSMLQPFIDSLGYKRVLVVAGPNNGSLGYYVFRDSTN